MRFSSFFIVRHDNGAPLPSGKLYVYLAGTGVLASLYDAGGSSILNPVTADTNGELGFAVANGVYDLQFGNSSGSYLSPRVPNQQVIDLSGVPAAGVADSSAGTLAQMVADFNALLASLRAAGLLSNVVIAPSILAEDGFHILAEDGSKILTE